MDKLTKVRATSTGFYGGQRRREGDEFYLDAKHKPSAKWMEVISGGDEPVKAKKPKPDPKSQQAEAAADAKALDEAHDATNSAKTKPVEGEEGKGDATDFA